jgi:hypothetical protein
MQRDKTREEARKQEAQMQKMLSSYKREIERLKTENREVRARGSVAERGKLHIDYI